MDLLSFISCCAFIPVPAFFFYLFLIFQVNEKIIIIYSDKFILHMIDLNRTDLAATWEEIQMIAKQNNDLLEASETLFTLNSDYMIRKQCEARGDYYRLHNTIQKQLNDAIKIYALPKSVL